MTDGRFSVGCGAGEDLQRNGRFGPLDTLLPSAPHESRDGDSAVFSPLLDGAQSPDAEALSILTPSPGIPASPSGTPEDARTTSSLPPPGRCLLRYSNQVGGHCALVKMADSSRLFKPLLEMGELRFYQRVLALLEASQITHSGVRASTQRGVSSSATSPPQDEAVTHDIRPSNASRSSSRGVWETETDTSLLPLPISSNSSTSRVRPPSSSSTPQARSPASQRHGRALTDDITPPLIRFAAFVPRFFGTVTIPLCAGPSDGVHEPSPPWTHQATPVVPGNTHKPQAQQTQQTQQTYLVLQDLVDGYRKACILDVKMGQSQRKRLASPRKRHKQLEKAFATTSNSLGFRLCGLRFYDQKSRRMKYRDKYYGRRIKTSKILSVLNDFFVGSATARLLLFNRLINRLKELHEVVKNLRHWRLWSTSLLIYYDAGALSSADMAESCHVKVIDFANVAFIPERGDGDGEFLFGLENLAKALTVLAVLQERNIGAQETRSKPDAVNREVTDEDCASHSRRRHNVSLADAPRDFREQGRLQRSRLYDRDRGRRSTRRSLHRRSSSVGTYIPALSNAYSSKAEFRADPFPFSLHSSPTSAVEMELVSDACLNALGFSRKVSLASKSGVREQCSPVDDLRSDVRARSLSDPGCSGFSQHPLESLSIEQAIGGPGVPLEESELPYLPYIRSSNTDLSASALAPPGLSIPIERRQQVSLLAETTDRHFEECVSLPLGELLRPNRRTQESSEIRGRPSHGWHTVNPRREDRANGSSAQSRYCSGMQEILPAQTSFATNATPPRGAASVFSSQSSSPQHSDSSDRRFEPWSHPGDENAEDRDEDTASEDAQNFLAADGL